MCTLLNNFFACDRCILYAKIVYMNIYISSLRNVHAACHMYSIIIISILVVILLS